MAKRAGGEPVSLPRSIARQWRVSAGASSGARDLEKGKPLVTTAARGGGKRRPGLHERVTRLGDAIYLALDGTGKRRLVSPSRAAEADHEHRGIRSGGAAAEREPEERCVAAAEGAASKTRSSKTESLLRLQDQLDAAARGTYVLGKDLDTVSQLVARLSDGMERENAMAMRCVKMTNMGSCSVMEMVSELKRSHLSSRSLAKELEEHVCLCLATILGC
ncbi:hypothetical protein PR202_gb15686 [Eleusine coracana subsp. coracana]|uniref:Uncharacterized protein n=1 Tax=Eleusine coracana subsp. coracana TaxID=191504 RepID=A0AAV5EZT3_ELECO|nr:hypothetical protein PR202_gb15686 [Eleusine coracana subsp. coracana]